jgi:uncharacterized membrane protein
MTNPFDPRTVLFARHAQHVVLIHFPIALFLTGFAFDLVDSWRPGRSFGKVAYCNVVLAGAFTLPTVLTGFLAWLWGLEGRRLHGVLLLHLVFGCCAAGLVLASGLLHWLGRRQAGRRRKWVRLWLESLAAVAILVAAHLGGFISGVNSTF